MSTIERSLLQNEEENERKNDECPRSQDVEKGNQSDQRDLGESRNNEELPPLRGLSFLDRYLVIWIILAMAIGNILGNTVPSTGFALQRGEFIGVSIPIGLAWAFLPDRQDLHEGLIFVGIARCIAMVLIWTDLAKGDGDYCAVLVAFNSILLIVLFAPFAVFCFQVVSHGDKANVSYSKVAQRVGVFLEVSLGAAVVTRLALLRLVGEEKYQRRFIRYITHCLIGLLYTIIVLFGSRGARMGLGYRASCTQNLTASNNFELAIAVVVAVYGAGSGQALASTVGPLIEVPVSIGLVYVLRWVKKRWSWEG
ncbi:SBF-domain-containing protein [Zopfia rhizophila CBS 207.26]|uniref:SBF-domain-containing protein n=1 Tax=Zopfia rhizophila CBS 207.26 TaxID=1314779 RepID=A0A6A6DSJ6_9PEZI|nr:SBF-domain-containing protein [Zopfia rhizophila CBS 207.26]